MDHSRRAQKNHAPRRWKPSGGVVRDKIPAMTDFRAEGTIMGPTGLTAVFGMGTGVAPPVWSPGNRSRGGQAAANEVSGSGHARRVPENGGPGVKPVASRVGGMNSRVSPRPWIGSLGESPEESSRRLETKGRNVQSHRCDRIARR